MKNKLKVGTGAGSGLAESTGLCLVGAVLVLIAMPALAESLLLTGATVHTVSGPTLAPGQVLIRDGKIESVGTELHVKADHEVDLKGQHLFPGLIAASTLLGLVEIDAVRATRDASEVGEYTPDVQSWIAVNPDSELIPVARANGITHILPVPAGGIVAGQSGVVALDGWTTEQMTIKRPAALHVYWPNMELDHTPKEQFKDKTKWKSLDDQAKDRRLKVKALEDFFEEAAAYANARTTTGASETAVVPAWEAMRPYARAELPIIVHTDDIRQIKAAVRWSASQKYKIILAGARDAWMAADLLAAKKIPVIYDAVFTQPTRDSESYDVHFKAPAILHQAGVKVAFSQGGRFEGASLRNLPYAAAQAAAFGLPEQEALKAITLYPAELLGVEGRLGSIEAGKEATLFAADGNILDIRANVKRMWIAGREITLESRHTRLYERYKSRPVSKVN